MCTDSLQSILDLKLHAKIFVSPFRRTIQSACHLLKNHPAKQFLTLVLDVGLAEHLSYKNVTMLHADALKRLCNDLSNEHSITIDTSFLDSFNDPRWWFLELIPDQEVRDQLQEIAR